MIESINNFPAQFTWQPQIQGGALTSKFQKFIVAGMGGSHLAADVLKARDASLDVMIHSDYGLPAAPDIQERLIIASSYSGNTEEALSAFDEARERQLPLIGISTGGELISQAQQHQIPYVQLPETGIQPRMALGYASLAMALSMGQADISAELHQLADVLKPAAVEPIGRQLSETLKNHVPIIYTSVRNQAVAYNWKIKLNETGKIPAFYNLVPELNHNEMTGLDVHDVTRALSLSFYFILIKDDQDDQRIAKRMTILQKLYQERGLKVKTVDLVGQSRLARVFNSLILADWVAYYTAQGYSLESEQVPMVEEFKQMMKN